MRVGSGNAASTRRGRRPVAVWATVATAIALAGCAGSFLAARGHARDDARRSQLAERSTSKALASDIQLALQHESDLVVASAAFLSEHPDASEGQFGFWAEAVRALDRYPELIGIGYT